VRRCAALVVAGALLALAAPASAHIDVLPTTVTQGEAVEFSVRVPVERDVATTRVRLDIPEQVTVFSFAEPPPGWTLTAIRGADGRVRSVVWSGGTIPPGRYATFHMLGTPFGDGEAVWAARQTSADGLVKPWTGPPEDGPVIETGPTDPGPAARVAIVAPGDEAASPAAVAAPADDEGSGAAVWLGVIAIATAAAALVCVGLLWSTRPASLPDDEEPPR
jgi:hypothetical protein